MEKREKFSSRIGFILISAGCAIGIGNVWRFPFVTGQYGGAAFVLVYLFFLFALGLPIMVMEFSVGRASQKSIATSFQTLEPEGTKWHWYSYFGMAGNYLLMMFAGASKRGGKDYYGHDVLPVFSHPCAGHKVRHTSGSIKRTVFLFSAGFSGHERAGDYESSLCGDGTGVLHTESWDWSHRNLRKLY